MNELQKPMQAIIAGASGLTGSFLLPILLQDNRYAKVIALSRRQLPIQHPKLETIITDGRNLEDWKEKLQGAHVFCCLGTTMAKAGSKSAFEAVDLEYPLNLAKICRENGARHYLLISALGANAHSGIYYNRIKGICEQKIRELNYPQFSIFRPSILDGPRQEKRFGEMIGLKLIKVISPLLQGSWKKYRPTSVSALATRMAAQAFKEDDGFWIMEG